MKNAKGPACRWCGKGSRFARHEHGLCLKCRRMQLKRKPGPVEKKVEAQMVDGMAEMNRALNEMAMEAAPKIADWIEGQSKSPVYRKVTGESGRDLRERPGRRG